MEYKLYCNQNPEKLGLKDKNGHWNLILLKHHFLNCSYCAGFLDEITKKIYIDEKISKKEKTT